MTDNLNLILRPDLLELLACANCGAGMELHPTTPLTLLCTGCAAEYPIHVTEGGQLVPVMLPDGPISHAEIRSDNEYTLNQMREREQ
jgi:uncharacterized protein YbaR (Trm112 family)